MHGHLDVSWWHSARDWLLGRDPSPRMSPTELAASIVAPLALPPPASSDDGPRLTAQGGAGTRIAAGLITDIDHNAEVRGSAWYGELGQIGIAGKMDRDPHVRVSRAYIENPLAAGVPYFEPCDKTRPEDVEAAAFATMCWLKRLSWPEIVRLACLAPRDGFAVAELLEEGIALDEATASRFPLHPGQGRAIVPKKLEERPANTIARFHPKADATNELGWVEQWLPGSDVEAAGLRPISADRLVRWTVNQEGANFAGVSTYRTVYGAWKMKLAFTKILAMKLERQGLGVPHISLPEDPSPDDVEAAKKILAAMRAHEKGSLITPFGYVFKWEQATATGDELLQAIEICKIDVAYNVMAGHMMLGLSTQSGAHALAQTQAGAAEVAIDRWAEWVLHPLNRGVDGWSPIERIHRLNYGSRAGVPVLRVRNLPTRDWSRLGPVIWNGVICGALTSDDALEDELREGMKLPPREPATARRYTGPAAKLGDGGTPPKGAGVEPAPRPEGAQEVTRAAA